MSMLIRIVIALLMTGVAIPHAVAAGKATLDSWVDSDLIPSVVSQLESHPRFRNAIVRFVVIQDGKPSATTNALAIALRDRLQDAVVDQSSVRVGWQVGREKFDRHYEQNQVDCTTGDVHYYIGLELEELRSGHFSIAVRALDIEEQRWVSGFGEYWQGTLTTLQHRAFRQPDADQAYLGQRTVPFEETQTDLLAAQIANSLGCSLLRQMSGEYVAALSSDESTVASKTLTLVSNNLANYKALQITANDAGINAVIDAKAHHIDEDLYQYWVTITPLRADSDLATITASAYVYMTEKFLPASVENARVASSFDHSLRQTDLLDPLEIVRLQNRSFCDRQPGNSRHVYGRPASSEPAECYALQTQALEDSVVFFLYHQQNNGLVRLSDRDCPPRTNAHVARQGQALQFPLSIDTSGAPTWLPGGDWMLDPDTDTYYAVASSNTKAARALAKHIELLPRRCGVAMRPGMEDARLRRWFRELETIAEHWRSEIDWQSVRVRNVF